MMIIYILQIQFSRLFQLFQYKYRMTYGRIRYYHRVYNYISKRNISLFYYIIINYYYQLLLSIIIINYY